MKSCLIGQLLRQILSPKDVRGMAGLEDKQPGQLTQMGCLSMSAPMLTFIGNFKFQRKALLQSHVTRPSFLDIQVPEDVDDQTLHIIFPGLSSSQSRSLQLLSGR